MRSWTVTSTSPSPTMRKFFAPTNTFTALPAACSRTGFSSSQLVPLRSHRTQSVCSCAQTLVTPEASVVQSFSRSSARLLRPSMVVPG